MIYIFKRLLYYISILLAIIFFIFILFKVAPKAPARNILGPYASQKQVDQLRQELGFDQPVFKQLSNYLAELAHLDLGRSYVDDRNVAKEIGERFLITGSLILLSFFFSFLYLLFILFTYNYPYIRRGTDCFDFLITSAPIFFSGILIALFTIYYYPYTRFQDNLVSFSDWLYLAPAALVLSFYPMSILSGILKKELTLSLQSQYCLFAESLGNSPQNILFRQALRNVLQPIVASLSNILPMLLTGGFIVEIIFSIPGLSNVLLRAILEQDLPMLQGIVLINGLFFIILNLLFEALYPIIDPRILQN